MGWVVRCLGLKKVNPKLKILNSKQTQNSKSRDYKQTQNSNY